jgi:hypothetical protein
MDYDWGKSKTTIGSRGDLDWRGVFFWIFKGFELIVKKER